MQPDPEDRYTEAEPANSRSALPLIIGGILLVIGVAVWFIFSGEESEPAPPPPAPEKPAVEVQEPEPELPPAPDIPEPEPTLPEEPNKPVAPVPEPEPALTLEDSDDVVRDMLAPTNPSDIVSSALLNENLLERSAALVDGFSRGAVLTKVLPLPEPAGDFAIIEQNGVAVIDPASYSRYDKYADAVASIDPDLLANSFHRFRPLLEQAYASLGYDPEDFDNALIRSLDRVLDTPTIDAPLPVVKYEAIYQYADPELEQRPDLQKQLLRMGPENLETIKAQAAALRRALLSPPPAM